MGSWELVAEQGWRKGPWTPEEDKLLVEYVNSYGEGRWSCVSKCAGLNRSGKSCRLRWVNYLRPGLKKGHITPQEEGIIIELHALWGNKWSTIARYLPGRTDNEIKNYWRTHFKKRKSSSCDDHDIHQERTKIQCQEAGRDDKISDVLEACDDQGGGATRREEEEEEEGKKDALSECRSIDQELVQDYNYSTCCWSDLENCLSIGGLWDMDDQNGCSKMAIQNNQANVANNTRAAAGGGGGGGGGGGDAMNFVYSGGYIF